MELHPRLHLVNVPQKSAALSLDEFLPRGEVTYAWWGLYRNNGMVQYTVYGRVPLAGAAPTVAEALEALAAFTNEHYGTAVMEPGYTFGLDFLNEDSGLRVH
jgi:hypothetical protein